MEAIILAGGLGTRLRSVCADRPKPMADVNGKPFLYYLMQYWKGQGVTHFILSVGYLYQKIVEYFGDSFEGIPIHYAIESFPLGTGGGVILALHYLFQSESPILVLNGDTYFEVSLQDLKHFQKEKKCDCCLSLLSVKKNMRYGSIKVLPTGQIVSLNEPLEMEPCLINGGCYLIRPDFLKSLAPPIIDRLMSLESEIVPAAIVRNQCYGLVFDNYFLDIGIPEDYLQFCSKFSTDSKGAFSSSKDNPIIFLNGFFHVF